jgi:ASC-1-like (ASCH) protein
MNTHELKLATQPFEAIRSGMKTIESRLFDEKRQTIQPGDEIIFTNRENPSETLTVRVVGLLRYASFKDLFSNYDPQKFGGETIEGLLVQVREFYPEDEELEYGVVGIQLQLK